MELITINHARDCLKIAFQQLHVLENGFGFPPDVQNISETNLLNIIQAALGGMIE